MKKQYYVYGQRDYKHSETTIPPAGSVTELRLCPVNWVTYNSYNTGGG